MSEQSKYLKVAYAAITKADDGHSVRKALRELLVTDENVERFLAWCLENGFKAIWEMYYE